jgi:hypothetical protein|tara:strand:+ start:1324 stop:1560 length:237 start_codon:yes stop_codon:yes gene_type:complete
MKVYHIKIDGYVVPALVEDFNEDIKTTPANWDFDQLIVALSEHCTITETMHEIPDELVLSMNRKVVAKIVNKDNIPDV